MEFACHSSQCRPPSAGGTGGSIPGGSQSAAYLAMKRRDAQQQATIQVNKYRAGIGMPALAVTESDRRKQAETEPEPEIPMQGTGRRAVEIKNVGKFKARIMPDSMLARLYPSTTGQARKSIKAEMSRRGLRYQEVLEKSKSA